MKNCWKAEISKMAESDIFYVKRGADHNGAMEKWLRPLFVELGEFWSPKLSVQNGLEKLVFTATFEITLRAYGDPDVTERNLE